MSEMKIILERWKCFSENKETLNEAPKDSMCPQSDTPQEPGDVSTIGELYNFILAKEPGRLKRFIAKASKATTKAAGVGAGVATTVATGGADAGAATGVGTIVANELASEVVQLLLTNAAVYFANMPDTEVDEGSVAWYFDHDDQIQMFLRGQEQGKVASNKMSKIEKQVFKEMSAYVKSVVNASTDCESTVAFILGDITARAKMNAALADGEVGGGKVKITPTSE